MSSFSIAPGIERRPRPRSFWLIASIAVNLILVGLIASWVIGMRVHQPLIGWQRDLVGSVSAEDATVIGKAADQMEQVQIHTDQLLGAQYTKLKDALRAQPFSTLDCQKVLDEMAFIRDDQQISFQRIFAEEAAALSPDGRSKLVEAMDREGRRWHPPWH